MNLLPQLAVAALVAAVIPGCADTPVFGGSDAPAVHERVEYGVVENIDLYREGGGSPTGLGAILGGIAGGVIGHQIGAGRGNDVATVAGALGGAYVGNQVQKSSDSDRYRITVRLNNGTRLEVTEVGEGELRIGDRVRVVNNRVYRD